MVVNNLNNEVYEHYLTVSKTNSINNKHSIQAIAKECSIREKVKYILDKDLTNCDRQYRIPYLPIYNRPLNDELLKKVKRVYDSNLLELAKLMNLEYANKNKLSQKSM